MGDRKHHKIVIIGAGMAGLGAAKTLVENKVEDFLMLEAQDQPGGRIRTIFVDNKALDLGAQWLHGKDNELYHLAMKHDLLSEESSQEGTGLYVRTNGEVVDDFTVKIIDFKIGQILEECAKLVDSEVYPSSLNDYLEPNFNEYLQQEATDSRKKAIIQELFDWHVRFQVIDNSCVDLTRVSAKSWGEYVCLDDTAHYNLKYGYQSLVNVILDGLPNNCIQLNSQVTKIGFTKENKVELVLNNNKVIDCDHLILTLSLGVLKEFPNLSKLLPEDTSKSIMTMGFHGICKIYLIFDHNWWGANKGFQLLWSKDCNFSEAHSWLRQVTGFDEVFNHPTVLMTWVGGEAVREVESLETEAVGEQCVQLLRKFLPNFSVPVARKVIRTKWLSDPFVKGSYCHISPECDGTNYGIRKLSEPVLVDGIPRIMLAGEAVHPSHYSTTHGAFESGQHQAQILCDYISQCSKK